MKWVSVNNGTSAQENFELWGDDNKLADISFSKTTRIARFVSNLTKRLFFFEKKGLITQRGIIKNEYGIKMGTMEEIKSGTGKGIIEMDGKKFSFVYNQNNSGDLMIYDEAMQNSLLTCSFNAIANGFSKTKSLLDTKFPTLLLVLCWYAFQPKHILPPDITV
jgi:hypothetical protein